MFLGRVVGSVWATVKWPELSGLKLLLVRPYTFTDLDGDAHADRRRDRRDRRPLRDRRLIAAPPRAKL